MIFVQGVGFFLGGGKPPIMLMVASIKMATHRLNINLYGKKMNMYNHNQYEKTHSKCNDNVGIQKYWYENLWSNYFRVDFFFIFF